MKRKEPRCPRCGDAGKISTDKICETCEEQLVYADEEGTLKAAEKERRCPRCNVINGKEVRFCENCGTEIGKFCGYCNMYHFIEDRVCPRTGEPIRGGGKEQASLSMLPRVLTAASLIAIMIFGFLGYKLSQKGNTPGQVVQTPLYVVVSPVPVATSTAIPVVPVSKPRIDVVFTVDTTGSMGDEIEVIKAKMKDIVRKIASGQPKPEVRYGVVAFRDRGDEYVTKKYDLTYDIEDVTNFINQLRADGGGDTPESVNEALNVSVNDMNWDSSANTSKLIFLIGDAEPHLDYQDDYDYRVVCSQAKQKGIKIHAIGCSGIESSGETEFREIAKLTGGEFEFLTYQQTYTQSDGTKVDVVTAGSKMYRVDKSVSDDEWRREGYKGLVTRKRAMEVKPEAVMGAPAPGRSAPSVIVSEKKNNLDEMFTQSIQKEAESRQGVRYDDK